MKRNKGFTLVELLIVVAIIGILSTLLTANFIGVRQRARDAQRKADLRQIQSALELYRADQQSYPTLIANCESGVSLMSPDCSSSTYMKKVPKDPNGASYYNSGDYFFSSNGTTYTLAGCLENANDVSGTSTSPGGSGCSSNYYYVLENP